MTVAMAKLHVRSLHDGTEKTLHFVAFRVGDHLFDTSFGGIVVEQVNKGRVGGSTEDTSVDVGKERILSFVVFPIRLLTL